MAEEARPVGVYLTMPADWMDDGFGRALSRVREAAENNNGGDAREIAIAAFDAASWAASIAERRKLTGDTRAQGLVFARHRILHGAAAPMYFDTVTGAWRWYSRANLPPTKKRAHEKLGPMYERHLAGQPVLDAFTDLEGRLGSS